MLGLISTVNVFATSSSVTLTVAEPEVYSDAEAVIVTPFVPSTMSSLTAVTVKLADVWPMPIVTVVSTVASVMSLLSNVTTKTASVGPVRVTVPASTKAPALSENVLGLISTINDFAWSLSVTLRLAVSDVYPDAETVIVTFCVPSTMMSSMMLMVKVVDALPSGISTANGIVASVTSLLITVRAKAPTVDP